MKTDVRLWKMDIDKNVSIGEFNNITDVENLGAFPGKFGDLAATVTGTSDFEKIDFSEREYDYYYSNDEYFYGIKSDCSEIIAIKTDDGRLIPTFAGAGSFGVIANNGEKFIRNIKLFKFDEITVDGFKAVKVYYTAEGDFEYLKELSNTYIFKDKKIDIEAYIYCDGIDRKMLFSETRFKAVTNTKCNFERKRINTFSASKKRVSYYWDYPNDNDFVHKETDAVVFSDEYGDYALYTYIRDVNSSKKIKINRISSTNLPIEINENFQKFDYKYNMSLVFLKNDNKATYHSLFKSKNLDFAAGVEAVQDNCHSTIFLGKDLHLNINVANIDKRDILFNARYNIIDYDGEIVEEGVFYNNKLAVNGEANRNIKLKLKKYGMYFLNLYVSTDVGEHRECFPFSMTEDYKFAYRGTNPFGIDAPYTDSNEKVYLPVAELVGRMGLSSVRIDKQFDNFTLSDLLKEKGVTRQHIGIPLNNDPELIEEFTATVKKVVNDWKDRTEIIFLANEADKYCKANYGKSVKYINNVFYPNNFKPAYDCISKYFPEKLDSIVWESNCHGSIEWLEAFYESGLWDKSEIIDIHSYSSPTGPDKCFSNQMSSMFASLFSNEYAVDRWKRITRRYGKKRFIIGETGYPSNVHNKCEIDNRTVADFNVRIALFFLEAGAELINYFCLFDRTSFLVGTGTWNENYFGACYHSDLFGRYMPKPWAAALSDLTRRFDGVDKVSFFEKYEEDEEGTLRAFTVTKKDNTEFAVLWSNIYVQPNTSAYGRVNGLERIPMPAWESRWLKSEFRSFDAAGDKVTVVDIMGNSKTYIPENGKVTLEITGSPIYVYGIK